MYRGDKDFPSLPFATYYSLLYSINPFLVMIKPSLIISLLLFCCVEAFCVPAKRISRIVHQNDGTSLELILCGDEYFHFYATDDGYPVIEEHNGSFCYASFRMQSLTSTGIIAHNSIDRTEKEIQYVKELDKDVRAKIPEVWAERMSLNNNTRVFVKSRGGGAKERNIIIGERRGLVILVEFANLGMNGTDSQGDFYRMFNEKGYSEYNHIGSVHDYFYAQSYGKFDLTFDVVGPVTLSQEFDYYGSNRGGDDGNDQYTGTMVAEACRLVDEQVDFADYDWNGDGEVEQIFVVYAGYGESNGAPSTTIWPHKSSLTSSSQVNDGEGAITLDGVKIDTYACSCELAGIRGNTKNGIGTACHEFSHCLGLPDFYDVKYNGGFGMNYWDLMSSGSHSGPQNNGEVPCGYSAYERWFLGWLDYIELNKPTIISGMPNLGDEPLAYIVYNDNHHDEYFILENRQNIEWFSYVKEANDCHGLIVTHVDYDEEAWTRNKVNSDINHQRMTIIPADNSFGTLKTYDDVKSYYVTKKELRGDPFPGISYVTSLTNTSHINVGGKLYNKNTDGTYNMNKPIEEIRETDGTVSFVFMGGVFIPSPQVGTPSNITSNGFTANWEPVDGADSYSIEIAELVEQGVVADNILISENMDRFKTNPKMGDGFNDLSNNLDKYMNNKGWSGIKVFTSPYGAKLGTSSVNGSLTSPEFSSVNQSVTIAFTARTSESDGANLEIIIQKPDGEVYAFYDVLVDKTLSPYVVNLEDVKVGKYKFTITSTSRVYVGKLTVYDGFYVKDESQDDFIDSHVTTAPRNKVIVNDVVSNSYTFENLSGQNYRYRVRTCIDNATSDWSDCMNVLLSSGMHFIMNEDKYAPVQYYMINGQRVTSITHPGLYIVKQGDRRVKLIKK